MRQVNGVIDARGNFITVFLDLCGGMRYNEYKESLEESEGKIMSYTAQETRYETMPYRRCGRSGLKLPQMSLGLWHNFGAQADAENARAMLLGAFDLGITHFDIANNYGPPEGSAEITFGKVLKSDLGPYRDEMIVSTKAGYYMWPGPYGEWGSRKQLMASLDQSLLRTGLDYVDIFYHHRPDPETPLEETMQALVDIVHSGKALYVGISNYNPEDTRRAAALLAEKGVPCLLHQMRYSMLDRGNQAVIDILPELGMGSIAFSPLAQGLLTGKYNHGIPADSRVVTDGRFLNKDRIHEEQLDKVRKLEEVARRRGQSIAQLALTWALREQGGVTSVIIGASRLAQIEENCKALERPDFTGDELREIDAILG